MHRSGTSAFAGALARLGVDFGERLAPPAFDNKRGFWEHPEIVGLHDELLAKLGSSWDDEAPLPAGWLKRKVARDIRSALAEVVSRDFEDKRRFGIKDPRLSRFVPLWLSIFQKLEVVPHFVLMVRHPWEVGQSLHKRNGMSAPKSVLLWLRYTFEAELATRGQARSLVAYRELLDDRTRVLGKIGRVLELPSFSPGQVRRALGGFLHKGLQHHRLEDDRAQAGKGIPGIASELYQALVADLSATERKARISELSAAFDRSSALFQPRIDDLRTARTNLEQEVAALDRKREEDLEEKAAQVLHFRADAEERARHITLLQVENEEKTKQVLHFQNVAEERARHIALLQGENQEKTNQVLHFKEDGEERARHIALLQAENEEKTKQILHFKKDAEERARHIALLQAENEEKTKQILHFKKDAEERARHIALLQAENEEKTKQILHFKEDAEERARHIALLQAENEEKTKQILHFKKDAEERARHIALLQADNDEKTRQVLHFQRDAEERARHIALLQAENEEKTKQIVVVQRGFEEKSTHVALLQAENEQKTTQLLHLQRAFEEKVAHVALLIKETEKQARQVFHFKREAEEKTARLVRLERESKQTYQQLCVADEKNARQAARLAATERRALGKTQQIRHLKRCIGEASKDLAELRAESEASAMQVTAFRKQSKEMSQALNRLEREALAQKIDFDTQKDRQTRVIQGLEEEVQEKDGLLTQVFGQLLDVQWEAITFRATIARQAEIDGIARARQLELQASLEAAKSDKQQLRKMVTALEQDLERELLGEQSRLAKLKAAQDELKTVAEELRRYKKQMNHLKETISRTLIISFGRSKRKLQRLATVSTK